MTAFLRRLFGGRSPEPKPPVSLEDVTAKLTELRRDAWVPRLRGGDGPRAGSKFAGLPWLAATEQWPVCPNCGDAIQFFLQLDLEDVPTRPEGCPETGLVQFFYCTNLEKMCEVECEAWAPGAASVVARLIEPDGECLQLDSSPVREAFPPKQIVGWDRRDDYPAWQELVDNGFKLPDAEFEALNNAGLPVYGEKLMGWPDWVQGVEYPACPECGTRMEMLFQIDSHTTLPWSFGDTGCGHLTQCPAHPHQLSFDWACC